MNTETNKPEQNTVCGFTSEGQKYEEMDFSKEKKRNLSLRDVKSGWNILKSQGKVFHYFLLMVLYFFVVEILSIIGWIPSWLVPILILPVVIAIFVLKKKHSEEKKK